MIKQQGVIKQATALMFLDNNLIHLINSKVMARIRLG